MDELNITKKDLKQTSDNVFFIVGTSRSGSTLLQSMLNSHSGITIPPETHYFYSCKKVNNKHCNANCEKRFRNELIEFWCRKKTRIADLQLCENRLKEFAADLGLHEPCDLYNLYLTLYRKKRGKQIVGEKTPKHILFTSDIFKAFPKVKIISLFRDPRAVAHSEKCVQFGSPSVFVTSKRWRKYVKTHHKLNNRLSVDQYMSLRYCDLVENTQSELEKLCKFLGVDFSESMLKFYKREEKGFPDQEKSWKNETFEPLKKNKNIEWKSELSQQEIAIIEATAGRYLGSIQYKNRTRFLSLIKCLPFFIFDYGKSVQATILGTRKENYVSL